MAETILSQSQLDNQMNGRDPFQMAQQMYQQQQSAAQQPAIGSVGPMQSDMSSTNPIAPQTSETPQSTISSLYQQPSASQPSDSSSSFESLLKTSGIDSQGLQFNDLGRLQLLSRIQAKYGKSYQNVPEAQNILKSFDTQRSTMDQTTMNKGFTASNAGAQRTLSFLMGGDSGN